MKFENIFKINNLRIEGEKAGKIIKIFGREFFIINKRKCFLNPIDNLETNNIKLNDYVSVVVISKNEAPYIKEWIEYHKLIGIDRIYFYDNESTDNTKEILEPYIKEGYVVYHYVKGTCMQVSVYHDAIYKYKNNTRWMAIIDLDEFIVPVKENNLKNFLKKYEKYSALCINWLMFDSNGYKTHPDNKLIIEAYTTTEKENPANCHIKSIINPKKAIAMLNPHLCFVYGNSVDENYNKCCSSLTKEHSIDKIRINHYYCKSEEDYKRKISRGRADAKDPREWVSEYVNFKNPVQDYAIQKFVPELKKKLK